MVLEASVIPGVYWLRGHMETVAGVLLFYYFVRRIS